MHLLRHLGKIGPPPPAAVLTLGNFDGVHCGHREILRRLVGRARARGGTSIVLTFQPHPVAVLAPQRAPALITGLRTRVQRIAQTEVDAVIVQRFTPAFAKITAEDFVREFLVARWAVKEVVVGHRVTFGHQRLGGAELLRRLGRECGFEVEVVGPVEVDGFEVSSSAIRRSITGGDLRRARALLGHAVSIAGRVIHGDHRGRMLGFPTANLRVAGLALPPDGVYAVRVRTGGRRFGGVANLGRRPTFGSHERGLETFVFDFDGDLYGDLIEVEFVESLRGEIKFPSVEALVGQVAIDVTNARRALVGLPDGD